MHKFDLYDCTNQLICVELHAYEKSHVDTYLRHILNWFRFACTNVVNGLVFRNKCNAKCAGKNVYVIQSCL